MTKRIFTLSLMMFAVLAVMAQGMVKGRVLDKANDEALGFVNIAVSPKGSKTIAGGATTDIDGKFSIKNLKNGDYTLTLTFVGYKTVTKEFQISDNHKTVSYAALHMAEDTNVLSEVKVVGQRSAMKLEVDRKTFDVSSNLANAGETASEVLDNIPSVEVDNDGNVSLRGNNSVEVWINGRSAGLTSDNMGQVLQQIPAESIDRIEVMDNPSAKFSAEGGAGIINIILKKDRKAGYYGSVSAGVDTRNGVRGGFNFNYNSRYVDFFVNIGLRHNENVSKQNNDQTYFDESGTPNGYARHDTRTTDMGNNIFSRAGITFHLTEKDDIALTGMMMHRKHMSWSNTPYFYGDIVNGKDVPTSLLYRSTTGKGPMDMLNGSFNYRHNFSPTHSIDFVVSGNKWDSDQSNVYQDSTTYFYSIMSDTQFPETEYGYQYRPANVKNRRYEVKLDYENKLTDNFKLETGYNGNFSKENTPNQMFEDDTWDGLHTEPNKSYYNRFIYENTIHAGYATANLTLGKLGVMAGLRGEYWKVNTESRNWDQEFNGMKIEPYKKDFFKLFPSLFMSYQLTESQQLQLNYTRRLRRPWGGQLNSFRNTNDASMVSFGNPELTPEYSNSFSLNYLKSWDQHSILVSAYYRPTTDVIQRINYRSIDGETMYSTSMNLSKSQSSGLELTAKNKLFKIVDLNTNVNVYYYKLDGFSHNINIDDDGVPVVSGTGSGVQTVTGESNDNFTWNARMTASIRLPYDISIQTSGRFNSREVVTQGYRPSSYQVDFGVKKNFLNRLFTVSINCRDVLNSRYREIYRSGDGYETHQLFRRGGRKVNFNLTWNFGNGNKKKSRGEDDDDDDNNNNNNNNVGGDGGGFDM
jgi:outer membrane receptor protein involved in Fe transport